MVRAESDNDYGGNYLQAPAIIDGLMKQYNEERLHATLGYRRRRPGIVDIQSK